MAITKIRKRNGSVADFDKEKIVNAIFKAAASLGGTDREEAERVAVRVLDLIDQTYSEEQIPTVEEIQDVVEKALIETGHAATAKAYILYRHRKNVEREMKRALGVVDDLKLPLNSIQVLERRYLLKDEKGKIIETPSQLFKRVALFIASNEKAYGADDATADHYADAFYQIMTNFEFIPNSPTLMNAGTGLGQLAACFVLPVPDDIEGIFESVKHQAIIHKTGGGTGFCFSYLRPKGDFVKSTAGIASGPISFMSAFDNATAVIKQGGKRRGANMATIHAWHPDVEEFVTMKQTPGVMENFNVSVMLDDLFMTAVEKNGDYDLVNPRGREPVRTINARSLFKLIAYSAWKCAEPGVLFIDTINNTNPTPQDPIHATNPCVTKDTIVTTNEGLLEIPKLHNPHHVLGRDGEYHPITWAGKTGEKEVFLVKTNAGYEVKATANHKMLTKNGWKQVGDLTNEDELVTQKKGRFGKNHTDKEKAVQLAKTIKEEVPEAVFSMDKESLGHFLSALFGNDIDENTRSVLNLPSLKSLKQVQVLLLQFGVLSEIDEVNLQLKTVENTNLKVQSIESVGVEPVYDLTEPATHSFSANGLMVHNCGEVPMPDYESCNLGSVNLEKFAELDWSKIDWKKKVNWDRLRYVVRLAVQFLDNVIDLNRYPIPQIKEQTMKNRRMGLGVMGFARMLYRMGIRYDSDLGYEVAEHVMKFVNDEARKMSHELGRVRGSFPGFKDSLLADKYDAMRNATCTSIAPTGTISMIADTSSGIEPVFALSFLKTVRAGQYYYLDPVFEHVLKVRGFYSQEFIQKVMDEGSIQTMEEIPEDVKEVFKVAYDISPEAHVKMQAAFQKSVELAVSKTINMPANTTVEDVEGIYTMAWKAGCKGITIYRDSSRQEQVLHVGKTVKTKGVEEDKVVMLNQGG
jgi:ribonucleoside-diphosphate reductase alpha chain